MSRFYFANLLIVVLPYLYSAAMLPLFSGNQDTLIFLFDNSPIVMLR